MTMFRLRIAFRHLKFYRNRCHDMRTIITKKRDRGKLTTSEIEYFVKEVVKDDVDKAQIGAMLMAMFIQGLDSEETASLTKVMTYSGRVMEWPEAWKGLVVDKHSTGGVGDKVSLVLAPALAACGMKVPMISGRGLGHTGGTLDKLESIPSFNVSMTDKEMLKVLTDVGCCIVGQTKDIVPADKILYAIRDVTATTENIGLITSSIISKKAAETLDVLVLDVKMGQGAFLKDEKSARELATRMVKAGNSSGVKTVAVLTKMDSPLGKKIGNALEVDESIQCLHGNGPSDLTDLVVSLGEQLLFHAGKAQTLDDANKMLKATLNEGKAIAKFCEMMKAQGVDPNVAEELCEKGKDVYEILPKAKHCTEIKAKQTGYVEDIEAMPCALVSLKLGAGRQKAGDSINFGVGLELLTSVGQQIKEGEAWLKVCHDDEELAKAYIDVLSEAIHIKQGSSQTAQESSRVVDVIT
ncbi:hypothetical protein ACF0H5_007608 [Mactra antiquata]